MNNQVKGNSEILERINKRYPIKYWTYEEIMSGKYPAQIYQDEVMISDERVRLEVDKEKSNRIIESIHKILYMGDMPKIARQFDKYCEQYALARGVVLREKYYSTNKSYTTDRNKAQKKADHLRRHRFNGKYMDDLCQAICKEAAKYYREPAAIFSDFGELEKPFEQTGFYPKDRENVFPTYLGSNNGKGMKYLIGMSSKFKDPRREEQFKQITVTKAKEICDEAKHSVNRDPITLVENKLGR